MTVQSVERADREAQQLKGHMGIVEVVLTVLAYSSPLTSAWGYLAFVIFFAGAGAPISFLIAMVILLIFSVGYSAMARGIKNPGAFYSFITHGINKKMGLGAAYLAAAGYFLSLSGVATFFGIACNGLITHFGGPDIAWYWLVAAVFVLVGVFGYIGVEFSAKTLTFSMLGEIVLIAIYDLAVAGNPGPAGFTFSPLSLHSFTSGHVGLGIMYAIVMFIGFEGTAIYREEARDPDKTIPRATYGSVVFLGVFYAIVVWMMLVAFGPSIGVSLSSSDPAGMFSTSFQHQLGSVMRDVANVWLVTAVFASTLSTHNCLTRYLYSLGVDSALPPKLGQVHPKQSSPYLASATATVASFALLGIVIVAKLNPNLYYGQVAGVASLCILILMVITSFAVIIHFNRRDADATHTTVWHTRIAPVLAILGTGAIVFLAFKNANLFMGTTTTVSIIFIAGIFAVYLIGIATAQYMKSRKPAIYAALGRQVG